MTDPTSSTAGESYPQLISLAVHEFRTPASVVSGYLRMLQRDESLNERQKKMIDEAEKSCSRLVALVAELSDIGKLDAGLVTLARQPIDVFTLAAEVAEHVQEGRDREVRLEVRGENAGASVKGDPTRLHAAFDAIFRAILREKTGPITVVVDRRRERRDGVSAAIVIVADENSVAAAYDGRAGVFDERRGGLGLALPLARRVIRGLGGDIWSPDGPEPLARGSIIIRFPLTE
jgi:signal transduction histidine kinase